MTPSTLKANLKKLRAYLDVQEKLLFDCLTNRNQNIKPGDLKRFVPALARYWKMYLNTPGVKPQDQRYATIHCAALYNFGKSHKYSIDYEETIKDEKRAKMGKLEATLSQQVPTMADFVAVRDLRI